MRITVSCPEALIGPANQLAMVLGEGPADAATFRVGSWRDAAGHTYAVASFEAGEAWLEHAQMPLRRPDWDEEGTIDMDRARQAQERLLIWSPLDNAAPPAISSSHISVAVTPSGIAAVPFPGLVIDDTDITGDQVRDLP